MNHLLHKLIATRNLRPQSKWNSNKGSDIYTETPIITSDRIKLIIRDTNPHASDFKPTLYLLTQTPCGWFFFSTHHQYVLYL